MKRPRAVENAVTGSRPYNANNSGPILRNAPCVSVFRNQEVFFPKRQRNFYIYVARVGLDIPGRSHKSVYGCFRRALMVWGGLVYLTLVNLQIYLGMVGLLLLFFFNFGVTYTSEMVLAQPLSACFKIKLSLALLPVFWRAAPAAALLLQLRPCRKRRCVYITQDKCWPSRSVRGAAAVHACITVSALGAGGV